MNESTRTSHLNLKTGPEPAFRPHWELVTTFGDGGAGGGYCKDRPESWLGPEAGKAIGKAMRKLFK